MLKISVKSETHTLTAFQEIAVRAAALINGNEKNTPEQYHLLKIVLENNRHMLLINEIWISDDKNMEINGLYKINESMLIITYIPINQYF